MRNSRSGLTLVELLVALGIAAIVGGVATRQMLDAIRFSERSQETMEMERSKVGLQRELNRVWSRARMVTSTKGGVPGLGQYDVNGKGVITFSSDLRPCVPEGVAMPNNKFFNPLTAKNTNPLIAAKNSSYTLVSLACCAIAPAVTKTNNPYGGTFFIPSACKNNIGITMNYRRFDRNDSYCYGDYTRANVNKGNLTVKGPPDTQSMTFNRLRFANVGLDHSRDNDALATLKQGGLTYIPQNAPDALFYVSLTSVESFTSGGQAVDKTGAIQSTLTSGADIANIIEFYGRLGNQTTSRLIDCGGGVERP